MRKWVPEESIVWGGLSVGPNRHTHPSSENRSSRRPATLQKKTDQASNLSWVVEHVILPIFPLGIHRQDLDEQKKELPTEVSRRMAALVDFFPSSSQKQGLGHVCCDKSAYVSGEHDVPSSLCQSKRGEEREKNGAVQPLSRFLSTSSQPPNLTNVVCLHIRQASGKKFELFTERIQR